MKLIRSLCGPFFIAAGANHFVNPRFYLKIMPPWLPSHDAMNAISGAAEIVGGAALTCPSPRIKRAGGRFTLLVLAAVYPANVHMALNPENYRWAPGGRLGLYARLPIQALFAAWVLSAMRSSSTVGK